MSSTIADDISWNLEEQLVVDVDERATDRAIEILEESGPDERVSVRRVLEYVRGDRPSHEVTDADWIRVLEHSDGRLALVSWTSAGITEIGLKCDAEESRRPFDVWLFSGIRDRMGDEPIEIDDATARGARTLLEGCSPTVVPVWETHLRPETIADGGTSADDTDRDDAWNEVAVLHVEPAPAPQTIGCPRCGHEHRVLIEDDSAIAGIRCENPDCKITIEYQRGRQTESSEPDHEQSELITDGGTDVAGSERLSVVEIEEIIEEVKAEVLAEDKLGASRNDVVEGTCQRIVRRFRSADTGTEQGGGAGAE